jgi:ornithine cyclodeaminase
MMIVDIENLKNIITKVGIQNFMRGVVVELEKDFARWNEFDKSPRHAIYKPNGVLELMPIADQKTYAFKYVNGHPLNSKSNKLCVASIAAMADVETGYPLMISEMTILTAIRTAATSALSSKYLAIQQWALLVAVHKVNSR